MLTELVAFPTVSTDSNLELINHIAKLLRDAGAEVEIFHDESGTKANLFATIGPAIDGGIVLSGHTDVVPVTGQDWNADPFHLIEDDGKLFGRGSCDMKGFVAAAVCMAPHYAAQNLRRPIHFAFTHDEETGCFGAQALANSLRQIQIKPSVAIVRPSVIRPNGGVPSLRIKFTRVTQSVNSANRAGCIAAAGDDGHAFQAVDRGAHLPRWIVIGDYVDFSYAGILEQPDLIYVLQALIGGSGRQCRHNSP